MILAYSVACITRYEFLFKILRLHVESGTCHFVNFGLTRYNPIPLSESQVQI